MMEASCPRRAPAGRGPCSPPSTRMRPALPTPAHDLPLLPPPGAPAAQRLQPAAVERDLVFGRGGAAGLKLDLARPADGPGPYPAVVCIPGGAWRLGDRRFLSMNFRAMDNQSL